MSVSLYDVSRGCYSDYLGSQPQIKSHPLLQTLAFPEPISWAIAEEIITQQAINEIDKSVQPYAQVVLYAKLLDSLFQSQTITVPQCEVFFQAVDTLIAAVPNLSLAEEVATYTGQVALQILKTNSARELTQYYRSAKNNNIPYSEVKMLVEPAKQRCFTLLLSSTADTSVADLIDRLEALSELPKLTEDIDLSITSLITSLAICKVPSSTGSEKLTLTNLLVQLDPSLQPLLEVSMNKEPKSPQMFDVAIPNLPEPKNSISNAEEVISIERLLSANTQADPKIYVFTAAVVFNGVQMPAVVKKFTSTDQTKLWNAEQTEGRILAYLSDKGRYFLKYYGSYHEDLRDGERCYAVVMERCDKSLMEDFIQRERNQQHYSETELVFITRSLLEAFHVMASHKIYHYDVKPHNILVSLDWGLKICDFNISNKLDTNHFTTATTTTVPVQGTIGYMAPEMKEAYDQKDSGKPMTVKIHPGKVDSYGLGMVLLHAATLETVTGLNRKEHQQLLNERIQTVKYPWLRNVLQRLLVYDFRHRCSVKEILKEVCGGNTVSC